MVRYRMYSTVRYGHFAEFIEVTEELQAVMARKGLTPFTVWTPTVGTGNKVVYETEYPDLATFEKESERFFSDADCMKAFRRGAELVVQDSNYDELWQPAPHLA